MIFVVGATGILGGEICRRLIDHGQSVRALTRTTSDRATVDGVRSAGAEIVEGNLLDPASLGAACQGAATVISTETAVRSAQADDDEIAGPRLAAGG